MNPVKAIARCAMMACVVVSLGCSDTETAPDTIADATRQAAKQADRAAGVLRRASPPGDRLTTADFEPIAERLRELAAAVESMPSPAASEADAIRQASTALGDSVKRMGEARDALLEDADDAAKLSLAEALMPLSLALQEFSFSADPMFKAMKQNRPPVGSPPQGIAPGGAPPMPPPAPGVPPRPPANETPEQMIARLEATHGVGTAVLVRFTSLPQAGPTMDMGALSALLRTTAGAREASVRTRGSTGFAVIAPVADFDAFCEALDLGSKTCDRAARTIEIEFDSSKLPLTQPRR